MIMYCVESMSLVHVRVLHEAQKGYVPCVVDSPSVAASGTTPLSTFIPGMIPLSFRTCNGEKGVTWVKKWKFVNIELVYYNTIY